MPVFKAQKHDPFVQHFVESMEAVGQRLAALTTLNVLVRAKTPEHTARELLAVYAIMARNSKDLPIVTKKTRVVKPPTLSIVPGDKK